MAHVCDDDSSFHDAIQSLLQPRNDSISLSMHDALTIIEAFLRQVYNKDGGFKKPLRDILSSSIRNCQHWEKLTCILIAGMEQRKCCYEDETGLSQEMTQETWSTNYDEDENHGTNSGADLVNLSADTKISLVPTSLLAATVYAQLLSFRGALAVGIVSMDAIAALANVINRWKVECCSFKKVKGKATKVVKHVVRRKGGTLQNTDATDMEVVLELDTLPVKRSRRTDSSNTQAMADFLDSDGDDDIPDIDVEGLRPQNLVQFGLQLARAVCQIPLQNEFSNSWKMEAIEIVISCITTVTATLQSFTSNRPNQDEIGIDDLSQKVRDIVQIAKGALSRSILVPDQMTSGDEKNFEDEESDADENDKISALSNLSRRHDITVATLRGLYPPLSMKEILPMGESGKVAAAQLASAMLEHFIQEIQADIQLHPSRWPRQLNANRRSSIASTVPSTLPPSPTSRTIDTLSPATPKRIGKHLRATPNGLSETQGRKSMTPKVKSKTPTSNTTMTPFMFRPGPVISALMGILQQMSTMPGLENASLRTSIVGTIHRCLVLFPMQERSYFLQFVVKLCHSKLPVHRLVASEWIGGILSEDWIWKLDGPWTGDWAQIATSLGAMSPHTPNRRTNSVSSKFSNEKQTSAAETLFAVLKGRLSDRTPIIRCITASAITNLCRQMVSSDSDRSTTRASFLLVLSDHLYDLLEILRDRSISDDKATVRRAACNALVDALIVGISAGDEHLIACSINEHDVAILSAACQDTSLMVRRAAADGLTRLIEEATTSSDGLVSSTIMLSLEKAWATSTIPMVLDSETSCVNKAMELVERLLIFPIISNPDGMSSNIEMPKKTAWRILAGLGVGANSGSSRTENDALCKAIQHCLVVNLGKANHHFAESMFRTIHATAMNSLNPANSDVFASDISDQRTGVWCLFNSVIGKGTIPAEIIRSLKKSKINMTFLCTSWDELLHLFLDRQTPQDSKAALQHSMRCCLNILSQLARLVDCGTAEQTASKLHDLLRNFSLPPEIVGSAVDTMIATNIASRKGEPHSESYKHCKFLLQSIYASCEKALSTLSLDVEATSRVSRILFTVGEISIVGFCASDDGAENALKTSTRQDQANVTTVEFVRGMCERPSKQLIEYVQAFMTDSFPVGVCNNLGSTPVSIRAHAFVALGKLCLRDATLAKQSLNVLARELHCSIESGNWAVQSNALIVLGDLCVKYTNMVDRFLPVMAGCLQAGTAMENGSTVLLNDSGSSLVRKHAILLLSSLILQDYVKWRGLLFHRFLVASVDDNDEVACLAEMVLFGPLLSKQPRLFANQFVESLFVLNCCTDHPIFKAAAAMGDGGSGISVGFDGINLKGDTGRNKRLQMYQMMLSKMSDEDKIGVTARIGKEVLGGALQNGSELNVVATTGNKNIATSHTYDAAFNVLSDALSVLKCPQIRVGRSNRNAEDDIEDLNVSTNNTKRVIVAKGRLLSNVSRKHLIEILMPILCNLKSILEKSRSPLLKDLMTCLLDVYQRHKSEARECLANDPTTLQEIEYDAQQQLKLQKN